MEKARRKIRVCLIFVVVAAVAAGIWYYCLQGDNTQMSDGTLVMQEEILQCRQ